MPTEDRIDGYAAAILEVARGEGRLELVGDELYRIARAFEGSVELREVLTDPRIPAERKLGVVDDLLGEKVSPLTLHLVSFIVSAGRSGDLPVIADRLAARVAAEHDRVIAEVRAAIELDDETIARLAAALSAATGKRVEVKAVVDPAVIGGVVARVGDVVIDGSVRRRFEDLGQALSRR
jgi:F-type H+-transporting ATPase subunit delta